MMSIFCFLCLEVAAMSWGALKEENGPTALYHQVQRKIVQEEVKAEMMAKGVGSTMQDLHTPTNPTIDTTQPYCKLSCSTPQSHPRDFRTRR